MKKGFVIALLLLLNMFSKAQEFPHSDSLPVSKYGDLLNDDPTYSRKVKWYIPASRVVGTDVINWAVAKYIYKFDWPSSGISDWKRNFKEGWEWDADQFGTNFIGH